MHWSSRQYWKKVVSAQRVAVIGWPPDVKFASPYCLTSLNVIGRLFFGWRRGEIYFSKLSEDEFLKQKAILEPVAEA